MFSIRPQTNHLDNLDSLTADVMEAFQAVTDTLNQPDPQTVVAYVGDYTDNMLNTVVKAAHKNVVDEITMAFLVNFLSPNL